MAPVAVRNAAKRLESWLSGPVPDPAEVEKHREERVREIAPNVYCFYCNSFMFEDVFPWFLRRHPELDIVTMTSDGGSRFFVAFRKKQSC